MPTAATSVGGDPQASVGPPASLVRVARTERFRGIATNLSGPDRSPEGIAAALIDLLARVGPALGTEPAEADWWRLLDALLLVGLHPVDG